MKIGVIGLGSIGMRHAKNLVSLGHKVAGYDLVVKGWDWNMTRKEIIRESDAIVIACDTRSHHMTLMECIVAGKQIFVEKPIADRPIKTDDFSLIRMVGYNLRLHSCVRKAKEWIDAGRIGKPLWANFTCGQFNAKPAYLRDGVILNWSHEIDLALHLLGPGYVEASSTRIVDGHDDMTDILLTHESGCRSTIHLDYITKPEQRNFCIQGERDRIFVNLPLRYAALGTDMPGDGLIDLNGSYDQDYIDEMKAFVDRIEGKQTPGCTGEEALKVLEICLEVRRQAGL